MLTSASPLSSLRNMLVVLGLVAAGAFIVFELRYLLVIFVGVLFGVMLHAGASWIARHCHMPHRVALALLIITGLATATWGVLSFAPTLVQQLGELQHQLPRVVRQLQQRLTAVPLLSQAGAALSGKTQAVAQGSASLNTVATVVGNSMEVLAGVVVVFFLGVYGAAQPKSYRRAVLAITPRAYEEQMGQTLDRACCNLSRWVFGRLVAMAFVGVTTTIMFHWMNLPMAFALGVLAGLLTFVEYAGAFLSGIPPVLIALAQSPAQAVWVLMLFTGLHVIEGYVLTPLLARATVRLPPGVTLACQLLLGAAAGALGLMLSTPLLVVAVCAVQCFRAGAPKAEGTLREWPRQDTSLSGVHPRPETPTLPTLPTLGRTQSGG